MLRTRAARDGDHAPHHGGRARRARPARPPCRRRTPTISVSPRSRRPVVTATSRTIRADALGTMPPASPSATTFRALSAGAVRSSVRAVRMRRAVGVVVGVDRVPHRAMIPVAPDARTARTTSPSPNAATTSTPDAADSHPMTRSGTRNSPADQGHQAEQEDARRVRYRHGQTQRRPPAAATRANRSGMRPRASCRDPARWHGAPRARRPAGAGRSAGRGG